MPVVSPVTPLPRLAEPGTLLYSSRPSFCSAASRVEIRLPPVLTPGCRRSEFGRVVVGLPPGASDLRWLPSSEHRRGAAVGACRTSYVWTYHTFVPDTRKYFRLPKTIRETRRNYYQLRKCGTRRTDFGLRIPRTVRGSGQRRAALARPSALLEIRPPALGADVALSKRRPVLFHSRPQLSQWISPASSCPASKKEVGESSPCRSAGVRPRPSATAWLFRVSSDEPEPALASDRTTPLSVACPASSGSAGPSPSVPVGDAPASTCSSCVFAGRGSSVLAAPSDAVPVASCGPLPPTSGSPSGVSGRPPAVRSFARFSPSSLPRLSGAAGLSSTPGRPRPGPATAPARCGTSPRGRRTGGRLGTPDRSVPSPSDGPRAVPRTPWNHGRAPAVCTGHP